jgi:hypothetical protein
MRNAVKVTTNNDVYLLDLGDANSSLATLQDAVGGWVQVIDISDNLSIWLNEEGKVVGLPRNDLATRFFERAYGVGKDVIVGDVVFTGGVDDEGSLVGLTDEQVSIIKFSALA